MTHEMAGKYALKHPPGAKANERIAKAIRERCPAGELACAVAEKIAKDLSVGNGSPGRTVFP